MQPKLSPVKDGLACEARLSTLAAMPMPPRSACSARTAECYSMYPVAGSTCERKLRIASSWSIMLDGRLSNDAKENP
jgi:hypothetical protein